MFLLKSILLINLLQIISSYPYFPECSNYESDSVILNTLNGKVEGACYNVTVNYGSKSPESSRVLTWLSIPYAEPPVGSRRFINSVPVSSWNYVLNGTKWSPICYQPDTSKTQNVSEDCLYLNLFVPYDTYTTKTKTPIYVHIHGGSFRTGSAVQDKLEPSTLVALSNVIAVTINYRVGPLGFMHIDGTDATGNQGFLDQHLALKWIYDNADSFGGDKTKITIVGQSAGSWSVGYHLLYKPSWPYFRNAILESGGPLEPGSKTFLNSSDSTGISFAIGSSLGCNSITNQELLECLKNASLAGLYKGYLNFSKYPPLVANGIDFSANPDDLFKSGDVKRCNILIGSNTKERAYFFKSNYTVLEKDSTGNLTFARNMLKQYFIDYNYPIQRYEPAIKTMDEFVDKVISLYLTSDEMNNKTSPFFDFYVQAVTDTRYKCSAYELAERYSNINQNAYVYLYGYHLSTSEFSPKYEAVHTEELAMIFAEPLSIKKPPLIDSNPWSSTRHNYSVEERLISETIATYWTNFVKYENPNGLAPQQDWPTYKVNSPFRNVYFMKELPFSNVAYDNLTDDICNFFQH